MGNAIAAAIAILGASASAIGEGFICAHAMDGISLMQNQRASSQKDRMGCEPDKRG